MWQTVETVSIVNLGKSDLFIFLNNFLIIWTCPKITHLEKKKKKRGNQRYYSLKEDHLLFNCLFYFTLSNLKKMD